MIVKEESYETSEPTVDSQVVTLDGSGANVFIIAATPKFAAQAIRKSFDLDWAATRYLSYVSASVAAVLKPAGLDKSKGLITASAAIDVTDPRWKDTPDMLAWKAFTDKYMSATEFVDALAAAGFGYAATVVQVLKTMRQRSLAREHHEAGDQSQGLPRAAIVSGHHAQHLADELQSDPPVAACDIQWRKLGADRGTAERLSGAFLRRAAWEFRDLRASGRRPQAFKPPVEIGLQVLDVLEADAETNRWPAGRKAGRGATGRAVERNGEAFKSGP